MIETRLITSFVAVAEELHFGRAAMRLGLAQPALTRQIQLLEARLEVQLLERSRRSVALTPAGRMFLERARRILAEIGETTRAVRRVEAGQEGRLAIGVIHSSSYGIAPAILRGFRRHHPRVDLELLEMTIAEQITALRAGTIDVGILRPPIADPALVTSLLCAERFVVALPQSHPYAGKRSVHLRDLAEDRFILFSESRSPLFSGRILAMCETAGFVPEVAQSAAQIHTMVGLVSADMGVAILPEVAMNLNVPGVRWAEIADRPPKVEIHLGWRGADLSPARVAFCDLARKSVAALGTARVPAEGEPAA